MPDLLIVEIDRVPTVFHSIEVLNLQKNKIQDIGEIKQFSQLKKLDLKENSIKDLENLLISLKNLINLIELNLEDNPVLENGFNVKSKIIAAIPKLKLLNSIRITNETRKNAESKLAQEKELWEMLLKAHINYIAHKAVLNKLQVHAGLQDLYHEQIKNKEPPPIDIMISNAQTICASEINLEKYRGKLEKKFIEKHSLLQTRKHDDEWEEKAIAEKIAKIEGKISQIRSRIDNHNQSSHPEKRSKINTTSYKHLLEFEEKRSASLEASPYARPNTTCHTTKYFFCITRLRKRVRIQEPLTSTRNIKSPIRTTIHATHSIKKPLSNTVAIEQANDDKAENTYRILKSKVVQFETQDVTNRELAQKEIIKLKKEIKIGKEQNKMLIQQLDITKKQANQILANTYKQEDKSIKESNNEKTQKAYETYNKNLLKRMMKIIKNTVLLIRKGKLVLLKRVHRLYRKVIYAMKREILVKNFAKRWKKKKEKISLGNVLYKWVQY